MKILELIRLENTEEGVIGILKINKIIFCATLEPPERSNARRISCIPPSQYLIEPYNSKKFGKTYTVLNVPDRIGILFHSGNTVDNTEGCILVGETVGKLRGDRAVLNSGITFKRFIETLGVNGPKASLTIKEVY